MLWKAGTQQLDDQFLRSLVNIRHNVDLALVLNLLNLSVGLLQYLAAKLCCFDGYLKIIAHSVSFGSGSPQIEGLASCQNQSSKHYHKESWHLMYNSFNDTRRIRR